MSPSEKTRPSRRRFLAAASGVAAGALIDPRIGAAANAVTSNVGPKAVAAQVSLTEPFFGQHQSGIITPAQRHTYFAAFDVTATGRDALIHLLQDWTTVAGRLCAGKTAGPIAENPPTSQPAGDSQPMVLPDNAAAPQTNGYDSNGGEVDTGEALGLSAARLTITFGFGPGLFIKEGKDRLGLASRRPAALIDLPRFAGDQLVESQSGGDLSIQACADDPQVAFHAVRQLARLASGAAQVRWVQIGFLPSSAPGQTPRNLMGFKDGTNNPATSDTALMDQFIWAGNEGPDWMRGGSYLVARRIRIALEHWDRVTLAFQEQVVGRQKYSGAPLGGKNEFQPLDLDAADPDGNPIIPDNAHIRRAAAASNDGARILRRPYSYNDGVNFTSERWPPWRQGMEYDAGLFFLCYQRDPRTGFVKIFQNMAKLDMMNQFVTHTASGLFACPRGTKEGEYIGEGLFG